MTHRLILEGEEEGAIAGFLLAHQDHMQEVEVKRGPWSVFCRCDLCGDVKTFEVDNEARRTSK
jgi:hypothetical protein